MQAILNPLTQAQSPLTEVFVHYVDTYVFPLCRQLVKEGRFPVLVLDHATMHSAPKYNSLNSKNMKEIHTCLKAEGVPHHLFEHLTTCWAPLLTIAKKHAPQIYYNYVAANLASIGGAVLYTPTHTWRYMAVENWFSVLKAHVAKLQTQAGIGTVHAIHKVTADHGHKFKQLAHHVCSL